MRVCVRIHQGLGHSLQRANYCGTYERHPEEAEEKDPHAALLDSGYFRQPARHVEKVNIYIPNEPSLALSGGSLLPGLKSMPLCVCVCCVCMCVYVCVLSGKSYGVSARTRMHELVCTNAGRTAHVPFDCHQK